MPERPHILLTNDDGIYAAGIYAAYLELKKIADVSVVAPDAERSAVGHAITLFTPLRTKEVYKRSDFFGYAVNGMPADCVKIAVKAILPRPVDLVISGINLGPNTGTNVIYSGTISAATEARILGIPAIAVSLSTFTNPDFRFAARFTRKLATQVLSHGLPPKVLLNVNVPAVPEAEVRGVAITRQGASRFEESFEKRVDPRQQTYYWLAGAFKLGEEMPDADTVALDQGFISVTPLQYDLTATQMLDALRAWDLKP
jgi:5'-nucleotidase